MPLFVCVASFPGSAPAFQNSREARWRYLLWGHSGWADLTLIAYQLANCKIPPKNNNNNPQQYWLYSTHYTLLQPLETKPCLRAKFVLSNATAGHSISQSQVAIECLFSQWGSCFGGLGSEESTQYSQVWYVFLVDVESGFSLSLSMLLLAPHRKTLSLLTIGTVYNTSRSSFPSHVRPYPFPAPYCYIHGPEDFYLFFFGSRGD